MRPALRRLTVRVDLWHTGRNHGTMRGRLAAAAVAVGVALLAVGCGNQENSARTASPVLPNPFTVSARFSAESLGLDDPRELAIGPDGNLYVTDRSQRVTVISPTGKVFRGWGRPGTGPGEFKFVFTDPSDPEDVHASVAVGPDGMVYVSDSGNNRVQVFTPQGRFIRQFGSFGREKGQFLSVAGLQIDDAGNVYVIDDQRPGVLTKFSPSGEAVWLTEGMASEDPDIAGHFLLGSIDAHGRLVIANDDAGRILYIDRNGHKVDAFGSSGEFPGGACNVTVDAQGYTYVDSCGPRPAATKVFNRAHALVGEWHGPGDPLALSPRFGPNGEAFTLGWDGSILKLHITLPEG
jgi:hypothetical protein